jgi:hypothetical protein
VAERILKGKIDFVGTQVVSSGSALNQLYRNRMSANLKTLL